MLQEYSGGVCLNDNRTKIMEREVLEKRMKQETANPRQVVNREFKR